MNSRIAGLRIASAVFGLMCLGQLLRVVMQVDVTVGGYSLPFWPSGGAAIVVGGLSVWLLKLSRQLPPSVSETRS